MADEIVLIRHSQCIGNLASDESRKGNHSLFTHELRKQPSWLWPLTPFGKANSLEAGTVIRERICPMFEGYIHSPLPRAVETALHLGFTGATWEVNEDLRERKWGGVENLPYPERNAVFTRTGISPTENSITWRPPRGESMIELLANAEAFLIWVHNRFPKGRVLAVSHGGPIQAVRVIQHRVTPEEYASFISGDNHIRNCHIFHFYGKSRDSKVPMFSFERSLCADRSGNWCEKLNRLA